MFPSNSGIIQKMEEFTADEYPPKWAECPEELRAKVEQRLAPLFRYAVGNHPMKQAMLRYLRQSLADQLGKAG